MPKRNPKKEISPNRYPSPITMKSVRIGFSVSVVTMGPCMRWTKYSRRFYRQLTTHTSAVTAITAEKSNYHYRLLQIRERVRAEGRQLP